jgi:hypothetical protein
MGSLDLLPSQIAGTPIVSTLPLGVFGTGYIGTTPDGPAVLKVLAAGERLGDLAGLNGDPATLAFEQDGEDLGQPVLRLGGNRLAVAGCLVGGSRLQDAAIRAGEVLDPGQELARRLRNTDVSYRVKLLAGLAKAIEVSHGQGRSFSAITPWNVVLDDDRLKIIDGGIAFDPGAEEFDADLVHPDIRVYLAPEIDQALAGGGQVPESAAADVYGFAATARSMLENRILRAKNGRLVLHEAERYSEELERLFTRCLSTKPGSRPTMSDVRAELEKRSGDAEWRTTATWPTVAATGMAIVLLVATVLLYGKPESQSITAQRAFLAAAKISDLDARDAALEDAWVLNKGHRTLIPAAARLRAVDDYLRWVRGTGEFELARLLTQVEVEAVGEYDDDLSRTLRVVIGAIRRWELETEDDVLDGTHLLELPIPAHQAALAALAEAARTLDPATSTGKAEARWLDGIEAAGGTEGSLQRPLLYAQGAPAVGLESAWLADLVRGRLLTRLGKAEEALAPLGAAHKAVATFSTGAALGMALAQTGDSTGKARSLLSDALDGRESFVEMQLALARAALGDAHASGDLKAYAQAGEAFNQVRSAAKGNRELFLSARRGSFEAAFYAAISMTTKQESLPKARLALEQLVKTLKGEKALRRYVADVRLALGVVLTRLGKTQEAHAYLLEVFKDRDVLAGWASLAELDPTPKTRDRGLAVRTLLALSIPKLGALRERARTSPSEARGEERDLRARVSALLNFEEAKSLGAFRVVMLKAEVLLTRAVVSRTPGSKLEQARVAFAKVRDDVDRTKKPGDWLRASMGLVEVYTAMAATAKTPVETLAPLLGAADDQAALSEAPKALQQKAVSLRDALAKLVDAKALESAIDGLITARKAAWNAIDVERPRYSAPSVATEVRALRAAIASKGPASKLSANARIRVGIYYGHLARLGLATGSAEFVKDGKAGLSILAGASADPKAPVMIRHINLILGCGAYLKPESAKAQLGGVQPALFARGALARACGAADFEKLRASVAKGEFKGKRRAAAILARLLVDTANVPRSLAAGVKIAKANETSKAIEMALGLDPTNAEAFLLKGLLSFAQPGKLSEVIAAAGEAYALAVEAEGAFAVRVQAARLLCYASFAAGGDKALGKPALKAAAEDAAKVAADLFRQDSAQREVVANYGASYWVARIALATQDPTASRAYETYGALVGKRQGPPEAAAWKTEGAKGNR